MKKSLASAVTMSAMVLASAAEPASAQTTSPPKVSAAPTPAQRLIGDIAPKLADLTDTVLFGDVWERPQLSKRDRSLITVSALVALNRPDQLRSHLARARDNGLTEEELVEAIAPCVLFGMAERGYRHEDHAQFVAPRQIEASR